MSSARAGLWLAASWALLSGCDPIFTIRGTVVDCETGDAIVGVRVEMFNSKGVREGHAVDTDQTDPDGVFAVSEMSFGDSPLTLRLTKPGRRTEEVHLPKATERELELCLEWLESEPGAGDEDAGVEEEDAGSLAIDR